MPALTVDTTSPNSSPHTALQNGAPPYAPHGSASPQHSRPSSPPQPPYSPITPTLAAARLDTNVPAIPQQPVRTFTHSSKPDATFIPPPPAPVEVIDFDSNTDVLAVKSAISVLQMQKKKAAQDIRTLQRFKNQAMQDPEAFLRAAEKGEIRTDGDTFPELSEEEDENDVDGDVEMNGAEKQAPETEEQKEAGARNGTSQAKAQSSFPPLPVPQKVVKVPLINWAQYGVIGDSLDKLHNDQLRHPTPGSPARLGPDGQVLNGYNSTEAEMRDPSPQSPAAGFGKGTASPAKKPGKAAPPAKKKGK
ncbi:hypothetical protein V490_01351 [Pseudogymnoascus sp. VKM F-3557]|nr:hypothetical protein V490_01351 [Pseudogymnoascus sp. VKM F-3557]